MTYPTTYEPATADRAELTFALNTANFGLPAEPALRGAIPVLSRLAKDPGFLGRHVLPLLDEAKGAEDWYVAHRDDLPDGSSLQVFFWPPKSMTKVHDHASWGAFCCVYGSLVEERYARLDDGSKLNHASLRRSWRRTWREGDGVSTVLPYGGGIHRVGNPTDEPAISIHLYGPRMGGIDGRDYDLSRDHVCDRTED